MCSLQVIRLLSSRETQTDRPMHKTTSSLFVLIGVLASSMLAVAAEVDVDVDTRIEALPDGPDKAAIMLGRRIALDTPRYAPGHVPGGAMSCTNCHLGGGTKPNASPWYGLTGVTPAYRARSGAVESLAQRINECFVRSENGTPLKYDSPGMVALLAYMTFLSKGVESGQFGPGRGMGALSAIGRLVPDRERGKSIYMTQCAACHGANGGGIQRDGRYAVPPLWGDASYNIGAGMARLGPAAAFIKHNMPLGNARLTEQEAIDVAAFVTQQTRPDFAGKARDWPLGGKPDDARY